MLMRKLGRRTGYTVGSLIGVGAGCTAAFGIVSAHFALFCLGTFLAGWWGSFVQSYRFAATDAASTQFRARAISWVMMGGLVAAFVGPQTALWTQNAIAGAPLAGGFFGQAVLALLTIGVVAFLRPAPVPVTVKGQGGRPLSEIMRQPRFISAAIAGLVSYGLMSFMMTAAPLAMVDCGLPQQTAFLGIQWHILGMYGPSFFTGRLIERFGKEQVTAAGLLLIAAAAVVALSGQSVAHFWISLIVLGCGWNFGFIGATTLVTECYRPEERTKVQAANDFLVFGSVAIASFSSGTMLNAGGWERVAWLVFPPVAAALAMLAWNLRGRATVPA
jgi:MFS family permease